MSETRIDTEKIDDAVLALMLLNAREQKIAGERVVSTWKGYDWYVLDRLHEKGYIGDPKRKSKSVVFSDEGVARAERLFHELFSRDAG